MASVVPARASFLFALVIPLALLLSARGTHPMLVIRRERFPAPRAFVLCDMFLAAVPHFRVLPFQAFIAIYVPVFRRLSARKADAVILTDSILLH